MATTKEKVKPVMTPQLTVLPKNTVRLNIKREYLNEIVWGTKRNEYRDDTDYNVERFLVNEEGAENDGAVIQYDYALLFVERQKETHCALVRLGETTYEQYLDKESGEDLDDAYYFDLEIKEIVAHNLVR